eukprot:m.59649 g.59649  ORF g.59649 m.59649 type:complete len:185 (-) comp13240_c0_seq1:1718-2272(-)
MYERNTKLLMSSSSLSPSSGGRGIDVSRDRYPYCVVWTPLPLISWLLPFIGHVGIATSAGVIHDFAGPYYVSVDNMAFGKPTKYWQLDPTKCTPDMSAWDDGVISGSEVYKKRMHNLICDNCHSHVARCLNDMGYGGKRNWNMISIGIQLTLHSKYVNFGRFVATYLPFLIIVAALTLLFVFVL